MPIRVSNLRLPIAAADSCLRDRLAKTIGVPPSDLRGYRILRKSLDLRDKHDLQFVYSAEVLVDESEEAAILKRAAFAGPQIEAYRDAPFAMPTPGGAALRHRPVVVGSGPGGLIAAYFLAEQGYRPLLLERGTPVNERIKDVQAFDAGGRFDPESNYLFGEGGAGTFSDGKLTCRSTGPDVLRVLELFAECKGGANRRSSTIIARTWAAIACPRWSRRFAGGSRNASTLQGALDGLRLDHPPPLSPDRYHVGAAALGDLTNQQPEIPAFTDNDAVPWLDQRGHRSL